MIAVVEWIGCGRAISSLAAKTLFPVGVSAGVVGQVTGAGHVMQTSGWVIYLQVKQSGMGQSASAREIYLTIEAGETQSQQLFDFNSADNRIIANEVITTNTYIVHDGENLIYQSKPSSQTPLYTVRLDGDCLQLESGTGNEKALWRVLGQGEEHPLEVGVLVKIGKVKLQLKEVVEQEKQLTEKDFKSQSMYLQELAEVKSVSGKSNYTSENQCRICFDSAHDRENPLVCLCKCSGSVKYIHYACLKDWINNKVERRQHNNTLFFSYQETKCQICQESYQPEFTYDGRKYILLNLDNAPNPPYAIFQEVDLDADNKRFSVFLIGLGAEEITIGRNSNSTVVMKEISVSRNHCTIAYKNRRLFIRDRGSKFGTLVRVGEEIEFSPTAGLHLQYESKLIKIHEKTGINCCCAENDHFLLKLSQNGERESEDSI